MLNNIDMTKEQFAWKVFCEAPMEFLIGEMGYELAELENLFGKQVHDLILRESNKLTAKEKEVFINWNCESFDAKPMNDEFRY